MPELVLQAGARLAFQDFGKGDPILLIHGWAVGADVLGALARQLAADYRVILPSLRGHGVSTDLKPPGALEDLVEDLEALVAHLGLARVHLIGWSMGAILAWLLISRGKVTAQSVVSIDMSPRITNDANWSLGLLSNQSIARADDLADTMERDWPGTCARFVKHVVARGRVNDQSRLVADLMASARRADPQSMASLWRSLARTDVRTLVPHLPVPTLLVHGRNSQLYAAETAGWLEAHMPDARSVFIEQAGHAPHLEQPAQFLTAVRAFLAAPAGDVPTQKNQPSTMIQTGETHD